MADPAHTERMILTYQNATLTVMAGIMLAGIPWGYYIGNKVTAIEVTLKASAKTEADIMTLNARVDRLRSEMDWLKGKAGANEP